MDPAPSPSASSAEPAPLSASRDLKLLGLVLLVAALLRVFLLVSYSEVEPIGDQLAYIGGAEELLAGEPYTGARGPAYSAYLALCWTFGGEDTTNLLAPRIGNLLLSLAFIVLVWAFGRRLVGPRVGLLAAGVIALHPNYASFPIYLLSEHLYLVCLASGLLLAVHSLSAHWRVAFAAGLTLGLGVLTREMLVWFVPVLALLLVSLSRADLARALTKALALVCGAALVILPWSVTSSSIHDEFVLVGFADGVPLFEGNFVPPPVLRRDTGKWKGRPVKQVRWNLFKEFNRTGARTKLAQNERYRERAWQSIADRQPAWIFEKLSSNAPSLVRPSTQTPELWGESASSSGEALTRTWMLGFVLASYLLLYVLLPFGLARWKLFGPALIPLTYVGFAFGVHVVANAGPMRFQMPHEWILILAAATAVCGSGPIKRWVALPLVVLVLALQLGALSSWTELGRTLVTGEQTSYQDWEEEAQPFLEQDRLRRGD